MEAVMMHGSFDQAISPYKSHLKNPKKIHQNHPIISNPADYFWPSNFSSSGLLQAPPPPFLSQSYPPYSRQPPLLPLPTATPRRSAAARGLSCPPANKKSSNRSREPSRKSKSPRKEEKKPTKKVVGIKIIDSEVDMFSGAAVFTISPPPSSLPLPTFSCCKAEAAAGVDAGATNDLRRLLRLR